MTYSARRLVLAQVFLILGLLAAVPALAQSVDPKFWGTDGTIKAIACSGNTVYIGGAFATVGPCTGGGVPLLAATGKPIHGFPRVDGSVYAAVPDGEGGWFIGGLFDAIAGIGHNSLAHLLADGRVAAWDPHLPSGQNNIFALALSGHTLYVAGGFYKPGARSTTALAAVDTRTGAFLPWDPQVHGWAFCLVVTDSTIFVGGDVFDAGGQQRDLLAAVDRRTAAVRPWKPSANMFVDAMAVIGNTVYVAGEFTSINGWQRNHLAALDAQSGALLAWAPEPDGNVNTLVLDRNGLLVGGQFSNVGGSPRRSIALLDPATGAATPWVSGVELFDVYSLALARDQTYVGGVIARADGTHEYAVLPLRGSGRETKSWVLPTNRPATLLVADRERLFAGGDFSSVGPGVARANMAALDVRTGEVTAWDPHADGVVEALLVDHERVWAGGGFMHVGGQPRGHLAALDPWRGRALAVDPSTDGGVQALATNGRSIFAGGAFDSVAGSPRRNVAALDAVTGTVAPWDPGADGVVASIVTRSNTVYIGGGFQRVGIDGPTLQARRELAALDARTGAVTAWAPEASGGYGALGGVRCLALGDSAVYIAGDFAQVGGQNRAGLAAADAVTGAVTAWDPFAIYANGPSRSYALGVNGKHVYVSGLFGFLRGGRRVRVGVVDATTGEVIDWNPLAGYDVQAFAVCGSTVYAGGELWSMGGYPTNSFAAIHDPIQVERGVHRFDLADVTETTPIALAQNEPNPVTGGTSIRFTVPATVPVTLAVYDLQGRVVASLLDHQLQTAGTHAVQLRAERWPAGCYLYRLEAGGVTATRKMVVLR